ncbi:Glycosyl transferase family 2 [Colwellia chukchiensis]|uniref:Glycosyl transferase family 2 n=1 Tax=Colwellia chukchiensis TaxID=641665 RepID=A0A1H7SGA9_9GAMM|nr:glycosyltransferase [Colwellia chukchiensis]SEL70724.1 Glycosyl transferase family 2 [Colwellia chukchiensis]
MSELISVVVPVYNGAKYLSKTVESILAQDHQALELLLINDGSSDHSQALIESLAAQDPRVKAYSKANGGVANARNYGIKKAQGDFIAFCDQDDLWLPSKLSKQLPLFANDKVGLVYTGAIADYVLYNKQSKPSFEHKHRGDVFAQLIQQNMFTCCTAMARKSVIEHVGGFDDDLALMGVDDWHLWLKLSLVCEFDFVAEHLAIHVFHGDNYSLNDQKMHEAEIVCLDKIADIATSHGKTANWPLIKQQLHVRYAKSYIFSGLYSLAGDTYLRAHRTEKNMSYRLKGWLLKLIPNLAWQLMQKTKRKFARS